MHRIVTVSCEFGSGGRELGRRLAKILHMEYYDYEMIAEMTRRVEFAKDYAQRTAECNLLKELAEKSDCVIVGCCADYILSCYKPYRIFVYADIGRKQERCRLKGKWNKELSAKELKHRILEVEQRQVESYSLVTGQTWGGKHHYGLCVNTTDISIEEIAFYISNMFLSFAWKHKEND